MGHSVLSPSKTINHNPNSKWERNCVIWHGNKWRRLWIEQRGGGEDRPLAIDVTLSSGPGSHHWALYVCNYMTVLQILHVRFP